METEKAILNIHFITNIKICENRCDFQRLRMHEIRVSFKYLDTVLHYGSFQRILVNTLFEERI